MEEIFESSKCKSPKIKVEYQGNVLSIGTIMGILE